MKQCRPRLDTLTLIKVGTACMFVYPKRHHNEKQFTEGLSLNLEMESKDKAIVLIRAQPLKCQATLAEFANTVGQDKMVHNKRSHLECLFLI